MNRPNFIPKKRFLTKSEKEKMGIAHFTFEEVTAMAFLQGEEIVDPVTNLPAFPKLSAILKQREFRQIMKEVRDVVAEAGGRVPAVLKKMMEKAKQQMPVFDEETPRTELGKSLKRKGIGKDTQLALIPLDVMSFFDDLKGGKPDVNPETGLPMYWAPIIGAGLTLAGSAMGFFGARSTANQQQRQWEEYRQQREDYNRQQIDLYEKQIKEDKRAKEAAGFNKGLDNEKLRDFSHSLHLYSDPVLEHKKTGGLVGKPVKGPGNGQSDDIKVDTTKEGEWIWDASTVADLGDGSTDAGWKEIRRLEEKIKKTPGFEDMHEFKPGIPPRVVKTALSNGEYRTPTKIVTAIGEGDNKKGAEVLRTMTQEIRRYKNSNGDDLPPPIKNPLTFLKKASHHVKGV